MTVASPLALDHFIGKIKFHAHDRAAISFLSFAGHAMKKGRFAIDEDVFLDPNYVAHALTLQPFEPFFTSKFAVHGEGVNLFGFH